MHIAPLESHPLAHLVQGRYTGIAGKNIANPIAMLNAAVDMLRHLGHKHHATLIQNAINRTINQGIHTRDLGGQASSREVVDAIMKYIKTASD